MSSADKDKKTGPDQAEHERLEELLARRLQSASGESAPSWEELSEAERRAYRIRAAQILALIRGAGYSIAPSRDGADRPDADVPADAADPEAAAQCVARAERFLHIGEPLLAYNTVQSGLETWPEHLRLRQLQGIALARSGDTVKANRVLNGLREEGHTDGETMGPLARTHKDLGLAPRGRGADEADSHLRAAFEIYEESYRDSLARGRVADAYYTGINAAAMAVFLDETAAAREIAAQVLQLCTEELGGELSADATYWVRATMGEAALILGDLDRAADLYREAAALSRERYGDLAATRLQAGRLLERLGLPGSWLGDTLAAPPVLVFSGHMIDRPDRPSPRFPPDREPQVAEAIRERLAAIRPVAVYGSAACGTDILCLEAARDLGLEIHITLPFPPSEFRDFSVDFPAQGAWGERFDRLIEAADSLTVTSENRASGSAATFHYANIVQTGLARLRAGLLGTDAIGLAVWDGLEGDGAGGTAAAVDLWERRGMEVIRVDAPVFSEDDPDTRNPGRRAGQGGRDRLSAAGMKHELKAMLFADAVGYSKMTEDQIPLFISHFLGAVADLNRTTMFPPIHSETAGDGLYIVFDTVTEAGHYALELSERIKGTDWPTLGLPPGLDLRVAVHCGPIFCGEDPVTGLPLYTGPHTSRTARIEPITPPGQVYASRAFAAVAAAAGVTDLRFTYVGRTDLAKKYGALGLFHVDRA